MIIIAGETANTTFKRIYSLEELLEAGAFVSGPSRTRLNSLGLDPSKVRSLNLCSPGRWDPEEACLNARKLVSKLADEIYKEESSTVYHILAMGQRVSFAFGLPFIPMMTKKVWFCSGPMREIRVVCCPHPSGLSRWWNDPNNVIRFKEMVYGL